jgi:hypothetical protein
MVALVQHPDYEQWKAQVAALRQEVASTLEELDHLRNNVRPLLLALYRQKLGVLELNCLREQCRAEWLRRYAERVRAALNKGESVQLAEIGKALDGEMADREKLKAGAAAWRTKATAYETQLKTLLGEEGYGSIRLNAD